MNKEFPWFVNLSQGKFNEEMISCFTENEDYRKRVALHNMLAASNHSAIIKTYKQQVTEVLKRIDLRLNN